MSYRPLGDLKRLGHNKNIYVTFGLNESGQNVFSCFVQYKRE